MDNITHSLIGVAVGDWASRKKATATKVENPTQRRLWIWSSILANNFPDLDTLYTSITPAPLGSLLHHRGHTHTLVGLIPQWFLIMALLYFLRKPLRFQSVLRQDWKIAGVLTAIGLCLHIFADSWNSYGVHPFFPFWNNWVYGDAIFIVEPYIWSILGASLLMTGRTWMRFIPSTLLTALLAFGLYVGHINSLSVLSATIIFVCVASAQHFIKSISLPLIFVSVFVSLSLITSQFLKHNIKQNAPANLEVVDVILNPEPASPLCWIVARISIHDNLYQVKRGVLSLWPSVFPPNTCQLAKQSYNNIEEFEDIGAQQVFWSEMYEVPLKNFEVLSRLCPARAWMRFARIPLFQNGGYSDLRFSSRAMRNFSNIEPTEIQECPPFIPPWTPPRWDIIQRINGTSWFQND